MAGRKPAAKTTAKVEATEPKTASIKAEEKVAEPKAAEVKNEPVKNEPVKKETVKKETVKKTTAKTAAVKETTAKAATAKTTAAKTTAAKTTAKKATAKSSGKECIIHVQFAGKSVSQDELMKMAKDVWKFDLKQKVGDLKSVELYVKPEESMVYYVMNDEFTGSFVI